MHKIRLKIAKAVLPEGYYIAKMPKRGVTRKPRKPRLTVAKPDAGKEAIN